MVPLFGITTVFVVPESEWVKEEETEPLSAEHKAAMYYTSCLDVNQTVANLGPRPLLDLIWDAFGGWTLSGRDLDAATSSVAFNDTSWNLQSVLNRAHSIGIYVFFSVWVAEDDKMPTENILQVCSHNKLAIDTCSDPRSRETKPSH